MYMYTIWTYTLFGTVNVNVNTVNVNKNRELFTIIVNIKIVSTELWFLSSSFPKCSGLGRFSWR